MDHNRIGRFDPRCINDPDKADDATRQWHEASAREEAAKIASRYKNSPTYLKILSMALASIADKAYSKQQEVQNNSPEALAREKMRQEILAEMGQKPELMEQDFFTGRNNG